MTSAFERNIRRRACRPLLTVVVTTVGVSLIVNHEARAQVRWQIVGANAGINGNALANETILSGAATMDVQNCAMNGVFLPSVTGSFGVVHEYGFKCFREAKETVLPPGGGPPLEVQSVIKSRAFIDGDNTNNITIEWMNLAYCDQFTDGHIANARQNLNFNIDLAITNGPANAAVLVYYYWDAFGGASTSHECPANPLHPNCIPPILEDPVQTTNILSVGNHFLLGGRFDFASPNGVPGWNQLTGQGGAIAARVGDVITVNLNSLVDANLLSPEPVLIQVGPESDAIFKGTLRLTVGYLPPPIPPLPPQPQAEFSLDIGSDAEMSDILSLGNEYFDPGDMYLWGGPPIPACGASGFRDDVAAFAGADPSPVAPDCGIPPLSAAPVCAGPFNPAGWFDLDGSDTLDISLFQLLGGGPGPVRAFPSSCIYTPEHLAISFDDDSGSNYATPPGTCSVATNSLSPIGFDVYGTTARRDEVIYVQTDSVVPSLPTPSANPLFAIGIADEMTIHAAMAPNPDLQQEFDDDVDALDMIEDAALCDVWYFSPDHEATAFDPVTGVNLDGGDIYEVGPNGQPRLVVHHGLHLGLPDGVDVDAFEFTWLYNEPFQELQLALLFSVDDDDFATPLDESAGLDPATIYASFLDGQSFPYLTTSLGDDIDAISTWKGTLIFPTTGACCVPGGGCQVVTRFECVLQLQGTFRGLGTDCADVNQNGEPDACECLGCRGDLTFDQKLDGRDVQPFMNCFVGGPVISCNCADMDADGDLDKDDIQLFVHALLHGPLQPCP